VFSILCIVILPFIPEYPRWLAYEGRLNESLTVVVLKHANGDINSPLVLAQYREIIDTIEYEKNLWRDLVAEAAV
jgi:hypothetical protein